MTRAARQQEQHLPSARGCTERVRKLRQEILTTPWEACIERARCYTEEYTRSAEQPIEVTRALAFRRTLEETQIQIYNGELLVGHRTSKRVGSPLFPEVKPAWIEAELDLFSSRELQRFQISEEDKSVLRSEILPFWRRRGARERFSALLPPEAEDAFGAGVFFLDHEFANGVGHCSPDHGMLVELGLNGIAREIEEHMAGLDLATPEGVKKRQFLRAAAIACDGMLRFAARYASLASEMAREESDPERRQELSKIAEICSRVPAEPPRSFWEALQAIWFVHLGVMLDDGGVAHALGRLDQILLPLLQKDMQQGELTREAALELIECLFLKTSETVNLLEGMATIGIGGNTTFIELTIGGLDRQGRDATNELSFLFLDAVEEMKTIQPNCAARLHPETPEQFRRRVAEVTAGGSVSLQVVNDEVIIDAYTRKNVAIEDARDYAIIGCVEPTPSGLTYASTDAFFFNTVLCLEMVLGGGKSLLLGTEGAATGDPRAFETFREFMEAYKAQVAHFIHHLAVCFQAIGQAHRELLPCPFQSAMIRDCVGKGLDVKQGGARYNFTGGNAIGTAIVADSLMAIKKFVFDEKRISMDEMIEILQNNFEGHEDTRLMFLNRAPKYGNDDDEVDEIARELVNIFSGELDEYSNPRGGSFSTSLYSVTAHVGMGALVSATPDGRKSQTPLSVGISPAHGRDRGGPTLAMKSAAKIDYRNVLNGSAFNLKFHPSALRGAEGVENFSNLMRTYFRLGGQQLQVDVVDADTLRAAQERPEEYQDLIVRVAGYSARFVDLNRAMQDEFIARTEQSELR
ncbi:MAG: formate C-acetyltransferase/glycerol dehydratase family glycyl radical enzyme [Deltaproteobacteria bacterium]|nr:formate C-acetyltransferase/glycerol dehydratase family glycyl radical enzyme [Deltaproteobacteria bacterium]